MVNASLNWASIVGIVLAAFGLYLFYLRSAKPSISRDLDPFCQRGLGNLNSFMGIDQSFVQIYGALAVSGSPKVGNMQKMLPRQYLRLAFSRPYPTQQA